MPLLSHATRLPNLAGHRHCQNAARAIPEPSAELRAPNRSRPDHYDFLHPAQRPIDVRGNRNQR